MKKRILILCMILSAALLASCGKSDISNISLSITPNESTAAAQEEDSTDEEAASLGIAPEDENAVTPEDTPDAAPADSGDSSAPLAGTVQIGQSTGANGVVTDTVSDGTWPASFTLDSWDMQNSTLTVTLYTMDLYAADSIENLKAGSSIVVSGKTVTVKTVTKTASGYDINGGLDADGVSFIPNDAATYRVSGWDDHATYTSVGTYTLKLSSAVVLKDSADPNSGSKTVKAADLSSYLKSCQISDFNVEATTITVSNGEVTQVVRGYMP